MAEEIDEMWKHLKLTEDEESDVIDVVTDPDVGDGEAIGSEAFKQLGKCLGVKDSGGAVKTTNRALFFGCRSGKTNKLENSSGGGDRERRFLELERSRFGEKLKVTEEENNNGRNDLRDVRDKSQDSVEIQSCRALEAVKGGGGPLGSKGFLFREENHLGCSVGLDKIEGDPSTKVIVKGPEPATGFEFQATKQKSESAVLSTSRASQSRRKKIVPRRLSHGELRSNSNVVSLGKRMGRTW
ncbi:hypothetical protein COLO4_16902 [Corchorus olitorius]|uniref:Uncharacterized protein n=1 Tax=Corchorus olitorius TaxID=93759 RepID=A0A1R3JF38_9ROSI|nr:hypothetical protein COLO4_16902 [Corchorus olitorius]